MKRTIQIVGALLAILVVAIVILPFLVNANEFRPRLQTALTSALNRQVTLGDLGFSLFSGSVSARDLSIAEDPRFGPGPFVTAKSLDLGVDIWPLVFSHKLNVRNLTITQPTINLVQNQSGQWNFATMGGKKDAPSSPSMDLSVKVVNIANGRLSVASSDSPQKPTILENVTIALNNFAADNQFPFSFTGKLAPAGDIKLDGTAGPINSTDASLTPIQLTLKVSGLDLAASGITADSGVAGLLSIDGSASLRGAAIDWKGQVRLERARFVRQGTPAKEPVELDFAGQHNLQNHSGAISQGAIRLGNANASLTGSYTEHGTTMALNLRMTGSAMPVSALTGMLPALDIQLPAGASLEGGTASINATITGSSAIPVMAGTAAINDTKLKGFDLASKVGAVAKLAGIPQSADTSIQILSATARSDASGVTVQNLTLVAPSIGKIDGTGTINARHDLDFKMLATVTTQGFLNAALGGKGGTSIPFFVRGTSAHPAFEPDVAGIAAAELKGRLNGAKVGGVDAGQAVNALQGLFGGKKKK